jgi:hypothetical protein
MISKDANIFEFELPEEDTKVQRAKVHTKDKKFMKQTKEINMTVKNCKINDHVNANRLTSSSGKRNTFHKSLFETNNE